MQQAMLHGVYEENLRIAGKAAATPAPRRKGRRGGPWGRGLALLLAAAFVAGGGGAYHELLVPAQARWLAGAVGPGGATASAAASAEPETNPETNDAGSPGPAERRLLATLGRRAQAADYNALLGGSGAAVADIFGLGVKTIVIDPGHGGRDPGAVGPTGLEEKAVTLDIARELRARLSRYDGYEILLTRETDKWVALKDRVKFANRHNADLFISVHINYLPVEPVTFVETYYFGPHNSERALKLAERENSGSGYSVADFRKVVARLGNTIKQQESKALASSIQSSLFKNIRRHNERILNAGTKTAPFVVLMGVETPSVLAEVTCISNKKEERRLATEAYRERIASFLEEGIVRYLNKKRYENKLMIGGTNHGTTARKGEG